MPEIRQHVVSKRRRKDGLLRFAKNVQSQSGEDGILKAIFDALDDDDDTDAAGPGVVPGAENRWLVDVGAWDGRHWSNSYALLVAPGAAADNAVEIVGAPPTKTKTKTKTQTKTHVDTIAMGPPAAATAPPKAMMTTPPDAEEEPQKKPDDVAEAESASSASSASSSSSSSSSETTSPSTSPPAARETPKTPTPTADDRERASKKTPAGFPGPHGGFVSRDGAGEKAQGKKQLPPKQQSGPQRRPVPSSTTTTTTSTQLQQKQKWRGLLIEADPKRFASLKALHEPLGNLVARATVSCQAKSHQSLPCIARRCGLPDAAFKTLDLLTIDVDGADYWIWKSALDAGCRAKVVVIEFNPTIPHDVAFVQDRDDKVRHGSSLAALVQLADRHGYRLAETTTYNAFFVLNDVHGALVARGLCFETAHPTADLDLLHDFSMGTHLYQLYDGTLKLAGCKKLLWHRRPLDEAKIQHLDARDRVYPLAPPPQKDDDFMGGRDGEDVVHEDDDDDDAEDDDDAGETAAAANGKPTTRAAEARVDAAAAPVSSEGARALPTAAAAASPATTASPPSQQRQLPDQSLPNAGGSPTHKKTSKQRARSRRKHHRASQHGGAGAKPATPAGEGLFDAFGLVLAPALGLGALGLAVAVLALRRTRLVPR